MPAIPTKRLFVYIVAGIVVLLVGTFGVISMRGGSARGGSLQGDSGSAGDGITIAAGDALLGAAGLADAAVASSTTSTTAAPLIYVQVAGAVHRPGVYQVSPEARVFQVVMEAGGFTEDADQQGVALASPLTDGCRIYVPRVGEEIVDQVVAPVSPDGGSGSSDTSTGIVSINSATLEQLETLPGVGPAIAQDIITYREANGPFTSIDELMDVPGIGPARLERLRPLVGL